MKLGTRILVGVWALAVLVSTIFISSFVVALGFFAFGEVPTLLTTINALWMPWGALAVMLMIVLRHGASWYHRKRQAARG